MENHSELAFVGFLVLSVFLSASGVQAQDDDYGIILTAFPWSLTGYQQVQMIPGKTPDTLSNVTVEPRTGVALPGVSMRLAACAVDYHRKEVYVYDEDSKQIKVGVNLNTKMEGMTFHPVHYGVPDTRVSLAVDHIGGNLYFTNPILNTVNMQPLGVITDTSLYRVIVHEHLHRPMGITLDASEGYLFIATVGDGNEWIERCSLLGEDRTTLIYTSIQTPATLAIDIEAKRIYWVEYTSVVSADYNGKDRKLLTRMYYHFYYNILPFRGAAAIVDVSDGIVMVLNETTREETAPAISSAYNYFVSVCMYHPDLQPNVDKGSACKTMGCSHMCSVDARNGFKAICVCKEGFTLNADGKTCKEVGGSYHRAIVVTDGKRVCLLDIRLFSDHHDIFQVKCRYTHQDSGATINFMELDMGGRVAFLATTNKIFSIPIDYDQPDPTTLVTTQGNITGLSYDWVNMELFWTETDATIHALSMTTGEQSTLYTATNTPSAIAVLPHKQQIVWTALDNGQQKIISTPMDFSNVTDILNISRVPTRIAHDLVHKRLVYLAENTVWSVAYNGTSPEVEVFSLADETENIKDMAVYKELMLQLISRAGTAMLQSSDLGSPMSALALGNVDLEDFGEPVAVQVLDQVLQPPYPSPCKDKDDGGCEQICLPSGSTKKCACNFGLELEDDGLTCSSTLIMSKFMLLTDGNHNAMYQIPLDDALPVRGIKTPDSGSRGGILYDRKNETLVWSDYSEKQIWRMRLDETKGSVFANIDPYDGTPDRLALDPTSGNLYYAARKSPSASTSYVAVISRDGKTHRTLFDGLKYPRDIVLYPKRGLMYVVESDFSEGAVYKANMDGSIMTKFIEDSNMAGPSALGIDYATNELYVTDGYAGKIYKCDFDTGDCTEFMKTQENGMDEIEVSGNYLYYTGWNMGHILRINKNDITDQKVYRGEDEFGRPHSLFIYDEEQPAVEVNADCAPNDGKGDCSHLCLPTAAGHTCACDDAFEILLDSKTCSNVPRCSEFVENGVVVENANCLRVEGSVCDFKCNDKYIRKDGVGRIKCSNETWDNPAPCEPILCPPLSTSVVLPSGCDRSIDSYCSNFTCKPGYERSPDVKTLNCTIDGTWSSSIGLCNLKCPVGVVYGNMSDTCTRTPGSTCQVTCDTGYKLVKDEKLSCMADGTWNRKLDKVCTEILCPELIDNGVMREDCTAKIGEKCTYKCYTNFEPNKAVLLSTCQPDGRWSHVEKGIPPCIATPAEKTSDTTVILAVMISILVVFLIVIVILAFCLFRAKGAGTLPIRSNKYSTHGGHGIENPQYSETNVGAEGGQEANRDFGYATLKSDQVELTVPK